MRARGLAAATAAIAVAIALAGCTGSAEPDPSTPAPTPSATGPTMPDLDKLTPAPTDAIDTETGEKITPNVLPTWDDASRASAVELATKAMSAFAHPELDYDTWWKAVEPLLTQQAAEDYAYVDPVNIPARKVTGPAQLVDETSAYIAGVEAPTDAGVYTVILSRVDGVSPWLVERFTPPEGTH